MPRPPKCRFLGRAPDLRVYKPRGVPAHELRLVELAPDELEAVRLADLEGLYHDAAAERMGVSRATFGRLVDRARAKIAEALVHGHMLGLGSAEAPVRRARTFLCGGCEGYLSLPAGSPRPEVCPRCGADELHRADGRGRGAGERRRRRRRSRTAGTPSPSSGEIEP